MTRKKSVVREQKRLEKLAEEWEEAHTPGRPPVTDEAWSVDSEYGEMSFVNFESAYAYANGLSLGDFRRKVIDKEKRLIEVWIAPDHLQQLKLNRDGQADAAGVPC